MPTIPGVIVNAAGPMLGLSALPASTKPLFVSSTGVLSTVSVTGSGSVVLDSSPTIVTPTIASFANATHNHQNSAGGGTLDGAAIGSGTIPAARLGGSPSFETLDVSTSAGSDPSIRIIDADVTHPFTGIGGSYSDVTSSTCSKILSASSGGFNVAGFRSSNGAAFSLDAHVGASSPTAALFLFSAYKTDGASSRTAIDSTCPIANFRAGSTSAAQVIANGSLQLATTTLPSGVTANLVMGGGSTSPVLGAATADICSMVAKDTAASDRNFYGMNEEGHEMRMTGLTHMTTTDFSKTSSTTLANVTGLWRNVAAGEKYAFRAVLFTSSDAAGGIKFALGGTATATSIIADAWVMDGSAIATVGTSRVTALGSTFGDVTAVTAARCVIEGTITVNAAGTLTIQFAQNASNGTASKVLAGSYIELKSMGT